MFIVLPPITGIVSCLHDRHAAGDGHQPFLFGAQTQTS